MSRRAVFLLASLLVVAVAGCATMGKVTKFAGEVTGQEKLVSAGDSMQRSAREFTEEEKYFVGRTVAAQLLATRKPSNDRGLERYLGQVGQTVAMASGKPQLWKGWHFILLDGDAPEAFTCPGGTVMVSRALVELCRTEDELAAVLAHEAIHAALDHPMTAISAANRKSALVSLAQFGASTAAAGTDLSSLTDVFDSVISEVGAVVGKGYDRTKEAEADRFAVALLAELGYDPRALAAVLERVDVKSAAHGSPKKRAEEVRALVAKMANVPETDDVRKARFLKAVKR